MLAAVANGAEWLEPPGLKWHDADRGLLCSPEWTGPGGTTADGVRFLTIGGRLAGGR